jgi:DNA-binding transcriptional regulator YdaS (Cro superfamily)
MPISSLDKNLVTVSTRIPAALAFQIQTIAESRDTTISYLIFQALADMALDESSRYLKLRPAFEPGLNLSGKAELAEAAGLFAAAELSDLETLAAWIDEFGAIRLAQELGVSASLVSSWRHGRFRVAPRHCRRIEALSQGAVPAALLQPEVFGDGGHPPTVRTTESAHV